MPQPSGWGRESPSSSEQAIEPEPRHANGRKVRSDALPEHMEYRDTGCEFAPSCVRCPLVRCRYDEPGGVRKVLHAARDETLRRRRWEDRVSIEALAAEFGLSRRSVFRVLAGGRSRVEGNGRRTSRPSTTVSAEL